MDDQTTINPVIAELHHVCRPIGVYYNLNAELYHADAALGSTDIRMIRKGPRRYQLTSWMTPKNKRYDKLETKATVMGTALHCITLDGVAIFADKYVRRPDSYDEATPAEKSKITKEMNARLKEGQELLHTHEYDLCLDAKRLLTEHVDLRHIFTDSMHEVSVFWRHPVNGVPLKARFDILKPSGIGDIKTIENERGDPLPDAAYWAIKKYRYDIQAAHYMEGRRQFPALVKAGAIYCGETKVGDGINRAYAEKLVELARQCAATKIFAFEFVFLQKSFPEVWGRIMSPQNSSIAIAGQEADAAICKFDEMLRRYGTAPWPQEWRLGEFSEDDHPSGSHGWG
jgi:hypothetical protein